MNLDPGAAAVVHSLQVSVDELENVHARMEQQIALLRQTTVGAGGVAAAAFVEFVRQWEAGAARLHSALATVRAAVDAAARQDAEAPAAAADAGVTGRSLEFVGIAATGERDLAERSEDLLREVWR